MRKSLYINKTIASLIIFDIVQVVSVIGIIIYNYTKDTGGIKPLLRAEYLILVFVLFVVFINSFLTIRDVLSLSKNNNSYSIIKNSLHQVENLNNTLRAQRHDFMNHLQVVHGLIDMEEFEEAKLYIEKVFQDIQKVNSFLKTSNPAVNALLQAKIFTAEKYDIKIVLNIQSALKDISMPSWELCRVLGNIIDNAIYALKDQSYEKVIEVHIFENLTCYGFKIRNNGPSIPSDIIARIFEVGFTTKSASGEGMGLYICKDILANYGGHINVYNKHGFVEFEGSFKK